MRTLGQNVQGGGAVTRSEFVFSFGGFYVCVDFGGNWWWSASARVRTHGHTYSDRFYNMFHAARYMCVADKNLVSRRVCKFSLMSLIRLFLHTVFGNTYRPTVNLGRPRILCRRSTGVKQFTTSHTSYDIS